MAVSGELVLARDRNMGNSVRFINDLRSMDIRRNYDAVPPIGAHRYTSRIRTCLTLF
jgi:hypothetical protein